MNMNMSSLFIICFNKNILHALLFVSYTALLIKTAAEHSWFIIC